MVAMASCCMLATAEPDMSCAACGLVVARLGSVLETAKAELELSKETIDKRAKSIDKVQKAQTKRWLKNEYSVALRAGVEDEVETVCGHDTLHAAWAFCSKPHAAYAAHAARRPVKAQP